MFAQLMKSVVSIFNACLNPVCISTRAAQAAMLLLEALGVMVVMAMATLPMEETSTRVTSVEMAEKPLATTATVVMEEMPLVVSPALLE